MTKGIVDYCVPLGLRSRRVTPKRLFSQFLYPGTSLFALLKFLLHNHRCVHCHLRSISSYSVFFSFHAKSFSISFHNLYLIILLGIKVIQKFLYIRHTEITKSWQKQKQNNLWSDYWDNEWKHFTFRVSFKTFPLLNGAHIL